MKIEEKHWLQKWNTWGQNNGRHKCNERCIVPIKEAWAIVDKYGLYELSSPNDVAYCAVFMSRQQALGSKILKETRGLKVVKIKISYFNPL